MQLLQLKSTSQSYIHAPLALTGPDLVAEENVLLEIKNGVIVSILNVLKDCLPLEVKNHKNFYSLDQDLTLMPCLIDAHVHLALDGKDFKHALSLWDDRKALKARIGYDLRAMTRAGTGFIRDGGDCRAINLAIRNHNNGNELNGEFLPGPRIISTGEAIRQQNGYGAFLGRGYASPGDLPAMIEQLWSSGVDYLKLVISGVVSFTRYGYVDGALPSLEVLSLIVAHARRRGLKVMAHASSAQAVDLAVQAGVDSIEHGYYICSETLKLMAEKQIAWIPTVIPVAVQARKPLCEKRTPREIELIKRIYEEHLEKLEVAIKCGVPLGVGTDSGASGVRHGMYLIEEMLLYSAGSLSNRAILQAATVTNAGVVGQGNDAGAIKVGLKPYLIAVRGNPLENLAALKSVAMHIMPLLQHM